LVTVEVYGAHGGIHYLSENIFGNTTSVSSENIRVVCILQLGTHLEHGSELHRVICALIEEQRRLLTSPNPWERFRTLWTAALLDKHLTQCTDPQIGELMVIVQERFGIVEAEFAICYHARRRLLLK